MKRLIASFQGSPLAKWLSLGLPLATLCGLLVLWGFGSGRAPVSAPACCSQSGVSVADAETVAVNIGDQVEFVLTQGQTQPGGTWSAEFGLISPNGLYTAPTYIPASGLDVVTYENPDNTVVQVVVHLSVGVGQQIESPIVLPATFHDYASFFDTMPTPESSLPGNMQSTSMNVVPTGPTDEQLQAMAVNWIANQDALDLVPGDGKWHPYRLADQPQDSDAVPQLDSEEIEPVSTGGTTIYPVPTYLGGSELGGLAVKATYSFAQAAPQKCKTGPLCPPPPYSGQAGNRPGAKRTVYGPLREFVKKGPFNENGGSMTITASMAAKIKRIFGIDIQVGITINFSQQIYYYKQVQNWDAYKCVDGVWKYDTYGTCVRNAIGVRTIPYWVCILLGYPSDGGPGTWSPWSCHALP